MNWKAMMLKIRTRAMAEVEEINKKTGPGKDVVGQVLILLGKVQLADEMLAEYGVEVEDDTPKIILSS